MYPEHSMLSMIFHTSLQCPSQLCKHVSVESWDPETAIAGMVESLKVGRSEISTKRADAAKAHVERFCLFKLAETSIMEEHRG